VLISSDDVALSTFTTLTANGHVNKGYTNIFYFLFVRKRDCVIDFKVKLLINIAVFLYAAFAQLQVKAFVITARTRVFLLLTNEFISDSISILLPKYVS